MRRRNFSHAFAEKTLLEQERIIQSYITVFLDGLRDSKGKSVDICNLLNCLTFDTIGDLSLGQSFGSLEDSTLHVSVPSQLFCYNRCLRSVCSRGLRTYSSMSH